MLNSTEPLGRVPKPVPSPPPAYCLTLTRPICPSHTHNPSLKMATYNWDTSQHDFPFSLDACKRCLHPSPRMHTHPCEPWGSWVRCWLSWLSSAPGTALGTRAVPTGLPLSLSHALVGSRKMEGPCGRDWGFPLRGQKNRGKGVEDDFLFSLS